MKTIFDVGDELLDVPFSFLQTGGLLFKVIFGLLQISSVLYNPNQCDDFVCNNVLLKQLRRIILCGPYGPTLSFTLNVKVH